MRVLITGGTGFIGRHLTAKLVEKGYDLYVLARKDDFTNSYPYDNVNLVICDIREVNADILKKINPEVVIHMAALTPVRYCFRQPEEYMSVNYGGTVRLIEAMSKAGIKNLVHYSTAEVYFSGVNTIRHPIGGETPYGISKSAAELYVRYAWLSKMLDLVLIVRPSNTYDRSCMGTNPESRGYFVEKTITSMLKRENEIRYDGFPSTARSWIHVLDHVNVAYHYMHTYVFDLIGEGIRMFKIKNIVGHEASCKEIFEICRDLTNWDGKVYWCCAPRLYDPPKLVLAYADCEKDEPVPSIMTLRDGLKLAVKNWERVLSELGEIS